ncbi:MAG: preprotein translocase subunit SecY [Bacteroidetes bacterium 46-16]|nr:MAG: preprotein translocase subunit SecY [Bacteroidetes bacterium 46-16]
MKKLISTLKNIWSIEELRKRILFTILLVAVYRVGCYIALPGINPALLSDKQGPGGLLGILDMFAGGAFSRASIFALGVMPYISASIFMQLAGIVIPQVAKMQREESGRRKINQYTRYLTVGVTAFQASAYVAYLRSPQYASALIPEFSAFTFWLCTVMVLTAGTLFVMWMGEKITDKGIGNGTSLIIMVGILARLPQSLVQEFNAKNLGGGGGLLIFLIEMAVFIAVIVGLILLTQGVRKIPLNYARRIIGSSNAAREVSGTRDFIPLKVNSAGVMPIIFAQAMMFIPTVFTGFAQSENAQGFMRALSDHTSFWYNVVYAVMVIAFTYFYTALIFNPTEMADNLKRNNSFIPGVKPGEPTADYIAAIMDRITLPGAVFLAIAGILPGIAALLNVTSGFSSFYGGTSMLIGVGVILDTLQQIEGHLLMRQYDGLMKTGRISGRTSNVASSV